ncbi:MAG: ThuA domain-containing protein [Phycisphaerae bacterium]|jgi:type 1 glutamine amidotransferase|nr:ThuA domain-containing protein [Phycisphaerae bacterium]
MRNTSKLTVAMAIIVSLTLGAQAKGPTTEDFAKIAKAAPDKAPAKPLKPRKLLVFSLTRSYRHASIPCGVKAIEAMGSKTGAFTTVVSDDITMFEPEKIKQFDAIVMNNTTGELFLPKDFKKLPADKKTAAQQYDKKLKKSLKDFVTGGKGLAVIHGGLWCFLSTWRQEYSEIVGAEFVAHPWHTKVSVKIDDPNSPLCAAFGGKGFEIYDEIYAFTKPYSRASQRVLYSLDTSKMKLRDKFKGKRDDGDYALGWIKQCGKGRVFYSALGHDYPVFYNPAVLKHWLAGIQYALGDLKADAAPRPLKATATMKKKTKIVLIAGKGSHGKLAHAHAAGVDLFQKYLDAAGKDKGIETLVIKNDWPADPSVLDDASTIVVYSDGWGRHALMDKEKKRVAKIRKLMDAGVGLVCIHYAVCPPLGNDSDFLKWVGGYYEKNYSQNPHNTVEVVPGSPDHPLCRGWKPFTTRDEYYYKIRFAKDDKRLIPVMTTMLPKKKPQKEVIAWAVERKDGGRGFGFTGGHFHKNWAIEDCRKMILNAIWWTAKVEVPAGGVPCR